MLYILAATNRIAQEWAHGMGLPPRIYTTLTDQQSLRGIRNCTILVHDTVLQEEMIALRMFIKGRNITLLGNI